MGTENEPPLFLEVKTGDEICVFDVRVCSIFDMRELLLENSIGICLQLPVEIAQTPLVTIRPRVTRPEGTLYLQKPERLRLVENRRRYILTRESYYD